MGIKIPDVIKQAARDMRKNPTASEKKLWSSLRRDILQYRFLRQKPLYVFTEDSEQDRFIIPDFYCHEKNLILEVDGSIHNIQEVSELDTEKEVLLSKQGIKVLRIQNSDVMNNIEEVIQRIKRELS